MHDITAGPDTGRIMLIEWTDSGMSRGGAWMSFDTATSEVCENTLAPVVTVGLYMGEDDDVLVLAQSHAASENGYYNMQVVLKSCITKRGWLS